MKFNCQGYGRSKLVEGDWPAYNTEKAKLLIDVDLRTAQKIPILDFKEDQINNSVTHN